MERVVAGVRTWLETGRKEKAEVDAAPVVRRVVSAKALDAEIILFVVGLEVVLALLLEDERVIMRIGWMVERGARKIRSQHYLRRKDS